jgi:hypothetical protein
MGIISDNLARAVSEGGLDLTGFVWRGPFPAPITPGGDPRDATRTAEPGGRVDESGGKDAPERGRLDFVVRPVKLAEKQTHGDL